MLFHDPLLQILCQVAAHLLAGILSCHLCHVAVDHDLNEFLEACLARVPAQLGLCLGGVTPEVDNVGRTEEVGRHLYEHLALKLFGTLNADTLLIDALALELKLYAYMLESIVSKLAHGVLNACGDNEVFGFVVLKDEPHTLYIILGITPVAQRVEVTKIELVLLALLDAGCCQRDLTGYEGLATALALMVEEDAGAAEHVVGLAVLLDNPEAATA